jgi:hypothetical protein
MLNQPRHRGWYLLLGMLGLSVLLFIQCTVAVAVTPRQAEPSRLCQPSCAPVHKAGPPGTCASNLCRVEVPSQ